MLIARVRQEAEFRRVVRVKGGCEAAGAELSPVLVEFFRKSVEKRYDKLGKLAAVWEKLVPPLLAEHCALEGFAKGTLWVMVDSSSHLYELKQLLLAGLERQILATCRSAGLRKIVLKPGRWYETGKDGQRRVRFD